MIPYGRQWIDDDDIAAVVAALKSDYLTCGPQVDAFEREFAEMVGAKHAVAVCNATAALHLAMRVADIGPGDRVVTSPNTFLASANCAAYVGAIPDFCDIDPVSYNLCPKALEAAWKADTKAVVAVDYAGQPANMPAIAKAARERGAIVIEDGCHGVGGGFYFNGQFCKIGGHPWADMTTFSFHPVKTMTTGEGGMLVTNNDEYARRARILRSHGMERDPDRFLTFVEEPGPWVYEMQDLGYNYRITDIQCALGSSQLKKLPGFIERRRAIVARYNEAFAGLDWLRIPALPEKWHELAFTISPDKVSWHLYTVQIDFAKIAKSRTAVMHQLRESGIGTQVLYIPVYLQPWYQQQYGYAVGKCPAAEAYYAQALSLPLYPAMEDFEVEKVVQQVIDLANG
jgi:UDP-4-amino-4,6-dideoxy-N-acetyl-beta-L-altrosamine transaminase